MSGNAARTTDVQEKKETLKPVLTVSKNENSTEQKTVITLEQLKNAAITLTLLNQKHDSLTEKMKRLERFSIVHEKENAQIQIVDAKGEEFESNSPKSIAKLIEFWKDEFKEAIDEVETEIRKVYHVA